MADEVTADFQPNPGEGYKTMTTEHTIYEHTFGPEQARQIVAKTDEHEYNFRKATAPTSSVQKLMTAMRTGQWSWTAPPPIRLSDDWSMCSDGVHRLTACAVTGIPLRALVLVGDQWRADVNTDRGRNRTLAQFLTHEKFTNATAKAATIRAHMAREIAKDRGIALHHAGVVILQEQEMIDFARKWDDRLDWAVTRSHKASDLGMNSTGYSVFLFEAESIDHELAADFHADFIGVTESPDDPVSRLRQYANKRFQASNKRMAQVPSTDAFVKCWDLRMTGTRLKMWKPPVWDDVRFPSGYAGHIAREEP